jgi:hypothetical protein
MVQDLFSQKHYPLIKKQKASELTGLSIWTLKRYRLEGKLKEGIHWSRINSRLVLYNCVLLLDWMHNRSNPVAHERAVGKYLRYQRGLK